MPLCGDKSYWCWASGASPPHTDHHVAIARLQRLPRLGDKIEFPHYDSGFTTRGEPFAFDQHFDRYRVAEEYGRLEHPVAYVEHGQRAFFENTPLRHCTGYERKPEQPRHDTLAKSGLRREFAVAMQRIPIP